MPEKINVALSGLIVSIESLKPDPQNARKHNDKSLESIENSLMEYGQQKPIVAMDDGTVIAGNGLLAAAIKLGWKSIAAVVFDSPEAPKSKGYALADNRTAELSDWNPDILRQLHEELNLEGIPGFDEKFLLEHVTKTGVKSEEKRFKSFECPHCHQMVEIPRKNGKTKE